jgi:protein-disulfide isomerase
VTLVVFSDYLCPYCRALDHTLDQLLERDPQGIRIIYRHFPVHPHADTLAEAALCAADQGKFAPFHRLLFEKTPSVDALAELAREAGLSADEFSRCLSSGVHRARVQSDLEQGKALHIEGTPTLFVNGQRLRGAQSLPRLTAQIERAKSSPVASAAVPTAKR